MFSVQGRILLTGAHGMVGTGVRRLLEGRRGVQVLAPSHAELELTDAGAVDAWFAANRPEIVLMIAARVGGIAANAADPVGFLTVNSHIQLNLFRACRAHGVRKALFLGSSCIYPRACPQPMREEHLLTGPLEPTNEAYALAKIMGLKLAEYHHRQEGLLTVCPMLCNVYGTGDSFDLAHSHVLSALVRRFVDARRAGASSVRLWGTGSARREFLHVDDAAAGILHVLEHVDDPFPINLGSGSDISIRELAGLVAAAARFEGATDWDTSKPDGMPRKLMDVSRMTALGFTPRVGLPEGIRRTVAEYEALAPGDGA